MDGLQRTGKVSEAEYTRDTQEAQFKGYSVEIGTPSGVKASDIPEVHIRSNRSFFQMLSDTWTDLTAGLSVGTTKESRKLDAMIAYIKTGKGYSAAGDSHVYADLLGNRASALEQVLASPSASSVQKEKAAAAFSGVIKREGIEFHGREVRSLCSKLGDLETGVSDQDKALLSSIKHELGQQILKGSTKGLNAKLNTAEERLAYLNGYKNEPGGAQIAEGINEQIEILESAIEEQKWREMLLETAISSLGNKSFNEKLSAINDKIAAYTQATGGKPQAGEKHDAHVMDMVSSLRELYQQVSQELMSSDLERGGQREKDVKAALNGLKSLAKNIVNAEPIAGSTLERKSLAGLYVAVNEDLKQMGFERHDKVFLGRTN